MTPADRAGTPLGLGLADADDARNRNDILLGWASLGLRYSLWVLTASSLAIGASPTSVVNMLSGRQGPMPFSQRLILFSSTVFLGGMAHFLGGRLAETYDWARTPNQGSLLIARKGLIIDHTGVLDTQLALPWAMIQVIAFDTGTNHDGRVHWRRFPYRSRGQREFLFSTDGPARESVVLLARRPVAPNVAIVLKQPMALHNPHAQLMTVAFKPGSARGMPCHPPGHETKAHALLLKLSDVQLARQILMPSGLSRSLREQDLVEAGVLEPSAPGLSYLKPKTAQPELPPTGQSERGRVSS